MTTGAGQLLCRKKKLSRGRQMMRIPGTGHVSKEEGLRRIKTIRNPMFIIRKRQL